MQTGETTEVLSSPETHDVVQDVTDQKAPPDDEAKDEGKGGCRSRIVVGKLLAPTNPIGRQQCHADGDEMLLEIKDSKRRPLTGSLQVGPDMDAEWQVHNSTQHRRNRIENDDGVGK